MARKDWWHFIVFEPVFIIGIFGLQSYAGDIPGMLVLVFGLIYAYAIEQDAKYLQQSDAANWAPSNTTKWVTALLGGLSLGMLSPIISSIYLYKRFR